MGKRMTDMATYFLVAGEPLRSVCEIEHKPGSKCRRPHCVPNDAIWSGQWNYYHQGDLALAVKSQRRAFGNSWRRWNRVLKLMLSKSPAPVLTAWFKSEIAKHAALEPKFVFKPPICGSGE